MQVRPAARTSRGNGVARRSRTPRRLLLGLQPLHAHEVVLECDGGARGVAPLVTAIGGWGICIALLPLANSMSTSPILRIGWPIVSDANGKHRLVIMRSAGNAIACTAMYAPHVLPAARSYDALYRSFRWQVPAHYNIGVDVCDRWAQTEPGRTAIFNVRSDGGIEEISYGALRETSNRLANALAGRGIRRGDRVAILLPQGPAVA